MDDKSTTKPAFKNSMDLVSKDRETAIEKNNLRIKDSLMEVQNILREKNEKDYIDPNTGHKIVNASNARVWVAQNVAFVFATGAIFDKNDKQFLDSVIDFFNDKNNSYLPCSFNSYPYSSDIIKKFEKLEAIGNGNYHMCCFVVCYAKKDDLKDAPEPMFTRRGITEHMIDMVEIRDEISRFMGLYGFTKEIYVQPSSVSKIGKRDNKTNTDIKVGYDLEIDFESPINRELMSNIKTKDNTVGTRTRINGNVNGKRSYPRIKNARNGIGKDITNQIEADQYVSYTMPTDTVGANVRINDTLETRLKAQENKIPKYELFKDDKMETTKEKDDEEDIHISLHDAVISSEIGQEHNEIQMPSDFIRGERMKQLHKNNGDFNYISYGRR